MPYGVYLPGRWRSQPQGAVEVDWGHPLARGLRSVIIPPGRVYTDGVSRAANTVSAVTPIGYTTTGSTAAEEQKGPGLKIVGDHTVASLWWLNSVPALSSGYSMYTAFSDMQLYAIPNGRLEASIINNAPFGFRTATTATGVITTGRSFFAATAKTNDYVRIYKGGTEVGASSVLYVSNAFPYFESNIIASYGPEGGLGMGMGWARGLPPSELSALEENPWQLLRPRRPILYSLPSSTPVLSAATVIDIGSTSVRPRVTITI